MLITYNGKSYDQPLLETRFRMSRARHPFDRMQHLDLLFGARRLWKLRLESCRLVDLENRILGVERQGDLPGEMIPYVYFDFLRSQKAFQVVPDLPPQRDRYSVAGLPDRDRAVRLPLARRRRPSATAPTTSAWRAGCCRPNVRRKRCACSAARWRWGCPTTCCSAPCGTSRSLERRMGRHDAALAMVTELTVSRNPYRVRAFAELAKHYEHREKNYAMALEMTLSALAIEDTPEIRRREQRLKTRIGPPAPGAVASDNLLAAPFGVHRDRAVLRREPDRIVAPVHLHRASVAPRIAARRRAAGDRRVTRRLQAHSAAEILRQRDGQRSIDGARFELRPIPAFGGELRARSVRSAHSDGRRRDRRKTRSAHWWCALPRSRRNRRSRSARWRRAVSRCR